MKRKVLNIVVILLFIAGLAVFLYPIGVNYLSEYRTQSIISDFNKVVREVREVWQTEEEALAFDKLYTDMQAYNRDLYENGQISLQDPFSYEIPAFDLAEYGYEENMVGYISIPAMDVELPIYLGASKFNLEWGIGNLGYTSIPIGGTNTNTVLAGHRGGYRGTAMFRDIEVLQIGDKIYITNFWETLVYEVVETKVILPTDIQEVTIREGRDMVTLITCHPYTKNYQRYVVYCERVETVESEKADRVARSDWENIFHWSELSESGKIIWIERWLPITIVVILLLLIVIRLIVWVFRRRKGEAV